MGVYRGIKQALTLPYPRANSGLSTANLEKIIMIRWTYHLLLAALLLAPPLTSPAFGQENVPDTVPTAAVNPSPKPPATSPGPGPGSPELLKQLVDGLQTFYDRMDSFRADFRQTVKKKYRPGAQNPTPRKGVAYFSKPGKMRWDYQSPEQVYYVSNGETLWVYEVAENVAYKGNVKGM